MSDSRDLVADLCNQFLKLVDDLLSGAVPSKFSASSVDRCEQFERFAEVWVRHSY